MSLRQTEFLLGTSGWAYRDWVGMFYAPDLSATDYLPTYARQFTTVEIEYTFSEVPSRQMVQSWQRRTPEQFVFSAGVPRYVTHTQRLDNTQRFLEDFVTVMQGLGPKLGPLVLQLPEDFRSAEQARLEAFFAMAAGSKRLPSSSWNSIRWPGWSLMPLFCPACPASQRHLPTYAGTGDPAIVPDVNSIQEQPCGPGYRSSMSWVNKRPGSMAMCRIVFRVMPRVIAKRCRDC
jgi:hypothetical protein